MTTGMIKRNNRSSIPSTSFSGLVDRLFPINIDRFFEDGSWGFNGIRQAEHIPVNVKETGTAYEVELVAPGLKKEEFTINVNGDMLTVSFEHREETQEENKNENWLRKEYKAQSFTRNFTLDDTLDPNKINAAYNDGILRIVVPKKEGAQKVSRNIEIK